jgi:hypothetical protein
VPWVEAALSSKMFRLNLWIYMLPEDHSKLSLMARVALSNRRISTLKT